MLDRKRVMEAFQSWGSRNYTLFDDLDTLARVAALAEMPWKERHRFLDACLPHDMETKRFMADYAPSWPRLLDNLNKRIAPVEASIKCKQ